MDLSWHHSSLCRNACCILRSSLVVCFVAVACYGQNFTSVSATNSNDQKLLIPNCTVFAIDAIELPAQETGVLSEFHVQPGNDVKTNEIVGRIDASAVLMEEGVAMSNAVIAKELASDTTDEAFAESVLKEANIALENYREIDRRGAASEVELRAKQLAVEQAQLKLQHAKLARKQLLAKADLANKSLDAVRQRLKKFEIVAPFDGQITKNHKRAGEWVKAGESVAFVVRLSELRVDAFVPLQGQHPAKLVGRNVWVTIPGVELQGPAKRIVGKVTHYDPEVTSAGAVRIHATVQNIKHEDYWQLLPGMSVSLEIIP